MENINGHTLISMGYKAGPWFKDALEHIKNNDLSIDELKEYMDANQPVEEPKINLHPAGSVEYHMNIRAEHEDEISNVDAVRATMEELMRTPTIVGGAVMPDACPTGEVGIIPVGGVVAAKNAIHPAMHSADICCSVMATDLGKTDPAILMDIANQITHFGAGGRREFSKLTKEFKNTLKGNPYLKGNNPKHLAAIYLGTQGDGNHFLFVGFSKKTGNTVLVTHHGSRGLGADLYKKGLKTAENFRKKLSPATLKKNAWIPYDTQEGQDYWQALQIVRDWTKMNHSTIHDAIASELAIDPENRFWNEHNFVFKDDDDVFYHAKGATPLRDDFVPDGYEGLRLIPLNMSESILVVRGETTSTNLGFAPHGAGRNLSRTEHKRRNEHRTKEEIFAEETEGLDVRFFHDKIDISELPSAYKNANSVKAQMEEFGLGEVVDEIIPYGSIMAGEAGIPHWLKKKQEKRANKKRTKTRKRIRIR